MLAYIVFQEMVEIGNQIKEMTLKQKEKEENKKRSESVNQSCDREQVSASDLAQFPVKR